MNPDDLIAPDEMVAAVRSEQERAAATAYKLESEIVDGIRRIRTEWAKLAGWLYEFKQTRAWETLGYETIDVWLAAPDIEMSKSMYHHMTEAWQTLVVDHGVTVAELSKVDMSKAMDVLPALRRNQVDIETALADCEVLTRTDLRDRYQAVKPLQQGQVDDVPIEPDAFHYERCPSCGSRIRVKD